MTPEPSQQQTDQQWQRFSLADCLILFLTLGIGLCAARHERSQPRPARDMQSDLEWAVSGIGFYGLVFSGPAVLLRQVASGRRTWLTGGEMVWVAQPCLYGATLIAGQLAPSAAPLPFAAFLTAEFFLFFCAAALLCRALERKRHTAWTEAFGCVAVLLIDAVLYWQLTTTVI